MPRPARHQPRGPDDLAGLRVALYCRVSQDRYGTEKSVDDQEAEGRRWVSEHGAALAGVYVDDDRSASRYARRRREHFDRLLGDIRAGKLNAIWVWELSRLQRDQAVFVALRDLCRERRVLWVDRDRVQDPADHRDMTLAGIQAVFAEQASEETAERVLRGQASAAAKGRPHGLTPYGYRRVYDPATRALLRQEPDPDRAPVVREIFARLEAGEPFNAIRRDLTARGMPSPGAVSRPRKPPATPRWSSRSLYVIARNRAYIAQRVHQGEVLEGVTALWPPLVPAERFWAVQRLLSDAGRQRKRPEAARHLLSYQVRCAVCNAPMTATRSKPVRASYQPVLTYTCSERHCAGIVAKVLERYAKGRLLRWLTDPAVVAHLTRVEDTEAAGLAQADADRARVELAELYRLARAGRLSSAALSAQEEGLLVRVEEAERRMRASAVPSVLAGVLGPEAAERWDRLDLGSQREIFRLVAEIRVRPVGRGLRVHPGERVEWRWLLAPGLDPAEAPAGPLDPEEFYGRAGPVPGATAHAAVCEVCGASFTSARSTLVCSGTCKVRRSNRRRQAREAQGAGA